MTLTSSQAAYSLSIETHEAINEKIAGGNFNVFSLGNYLKNNIGLIDGVSEIIVNSGVKKTVTEWLQIGGRYEDAPPENTIAYRRSRNHFHNPLLPLIQAYYTDYLSFCDIGHCPLSAILWAQGPQNSDFALGFDLNPGGDWSWPMTRQNYYNALTSADKSTRDTNFANTFRGLGQLMHLVQDMSVPEHTRNDFHASDAYEEWVRDSSSALSNALNSPIYFDTVDLGQPSVFGAYAPVPIANLFDTNQYDGTNPDITKTLYNSPQPIGLAEYTNANYLSSDTMFSSDTAHSFPYPRIDDIVLWTDNNKRMYFRKVGSGDAVNHLAVKSKFWDYIQTYVPLSTNKAPADLDDECYKEYAQNLLPRAVGYSAGLLNYFFRGQIDMVSDPNNAGKYIIKNISNEKMTGAFSLYYDNASNKRILLTTWDLTIYANDQSSSVSFTPPTDAKELCKFMLVFRGQMGQEQGAVVGKVVITDQCITGRMVQAYTSSDGQWIFVNVFTGSGPISASFNILNSSNAGTNPYTSILVRFNLSNYDELIVKSLGSNNQYEFHKFTIDETSKTIHYDGIVFTVPEYTVSSTREAVLPACTIIEENVDGCGTSVGAYYKESYSWETFILTDFYYNGAVIKPFGLYGEFQDVYLALGSTCDGQFVGSNNLYYDLEYKAKFGVYFGGKLDSSVTTNCTGGALPVNWCTDLDRYKEERYPCSDALAGNMIDYYYPLAIFNESQYAYAHFQHPYALQGDFNYFPPAEYNQLVEIDSPAPIELAPWTGKSLPYRQIMTMLRKDAKQSFYDVNNSYSYTSDEIGAVAGHKLISADNPYHKNIGWQNGDIIECSIVNGSPTCKTLKNIGGSFGATAFDVILKFPD